jgi:hypothetical protein
MPESCGRNAVSNATITARKTAKATKDAAAARHVLARVLPALAYRPELGSVERVYDIFSPILLYAGICPANCLRWE